MIDSIPSKAFDGAGLARLQRGHHIARRGEIQDRREIASTHDVSQPPESEPPFQLVVEQHDVIPGGGETVGQHASDRWLVGAQVRVAPDRRDVMLEQAREFRMVRDRQDSRLQATPLADFRRLGRP